MNLGKVNLQVFLAIAIAASYSCGISNGFDFDHNHSLFSQVLQIYVKDGKVDYNGLKEEQATFNKYLAQLGSVDSKDLSAWTENQKLAYWINCYNAYTLNSILDNYPVKSIKKIPGVWKKLKHKAGGRLVTLDHIEHKILRVEFSEPRIHLAINCASIGCPLLHDQAYIAAKINEQLDNSVHKMLNNKSQFRIDRENKRIYLSKIFDWFRKDFQNYKGVNSYGKNNGVVSFFLKYVAESDQELLKSSKLSVKWLNYDWNLNGKKG